MGVEDGRCGVGRGGVRWAYDATRDDDDDRRRACIQGRVSSHATQQSSRSDDLSVSYVVMAARSGVLVPSVRSRRSSGASRRRGAPTAATKGASSGARRGLLCPRGSGSGVSWPLMRMLRLLLQRGRCVGALTPGIYARALRP